LAARRRQRSLVCVSRIVLTFPLVASALPLPGRYQATAAHGAGRQMQLEMEARLHY